MASWLISSEVVTRPANMPNEFQPTMDTIVVRTRTEPNPMAVLAPILG